MKKRRFSVLSLWRPLNLTILACIAALGLMLFRLQSLAPGLSSQERAMQASSASLRLILDNPINAPLKLLHWLSAFGPVRYDLLFARLPSVILVVVGVAMLAYILHRWYGPRSTLFGLALFICAPWILHTGRFAGPEIAYVVGTLALLAIHIGLQDHEGNRLMIYAWMIVNVILLFVPGFLWFVLLNAVWQVFTLAAAWRTLEAVWEKITWSAIALLGAGIATYSIIRSPKLLMPWLGLPVQIDMHTIRVLPSHVVDTVLAIAFRGPHKPELWLGQLPLLDLFLFAMLLGGIFFYATHWRAARTQLLGSYVLLGIILAAFGVVSIGVFVPILYIIAIAGIAYMLHFWLGVFPRNPLARATGIGLVGLILTLSCAYSLTQYFIAWPHNPETHEAYRQ